jgi:hypothetical protein
MSSSAESADTLTQHRLSFAGLVDSPTKWPQSGYFFSFDNTGRLVGAPAPPQVQAW